MLTLDRLAGQAGNRETQIIELTCAPVSTAPMSALVPRRECRQVIPRRRKDEEHLVETQLNLLRLPQAVTQDQQQGGDGRHPCSVHVRPPQLLGFLRWDLHAAFEV